MTQQEDSDTSLESTHTGIVIEKTNLIEQKLMHIISKYLGVHNEKKTFVQSVLLNNSLFNLSAKFIAYRHLNELHTEWPNPTPSQFQKILSIRNAFAHCPANDRDWQIVTTQDNETYNVITQVNQSVSGSGQIIRTSRAEVYDDFMTAYESVDRHLMEVLVLLNNS